MCRGWLAARTSSPRFFFQYAGVFVVVAIQTEQFPVTAVRWIVVVIVVFMVHRQLAQARAGKFTPTAAANPREQFERPLAISRFARFALLACFCDDTVKSRMIWGCVLWHGYKWSGRLTYGFIGKGELKRFAFGVVQRSGRQHPDSAPIRNRGISEVRYSGLASHLDPVTLVGAGCFLGFFASLVLRCCPLAMIVLLDSEDMMNCRAIWVRHCRTCTTAAVPTGTPVKHNALNDNTPRENVKHFLSGYVKKEQRCQSL